MTTRIIKGDCRDVLKTLADESVHCVVTSPPYWGLRDYGTATWEGGDPDCLHVGPPMPSNPGAIFHGGNSRGNEPVGRICHCGARRIDSQIGLEPDFNAYIAEMVAVFREVRRVLRGDGTLWLNLGDSYASSVNGRKAADIVNDDRTFRDKPFSTVTKDWQSRVGSNGNKGNVAGDHSFRISDPTFKPKDLCGVPWRVAFALQADGWWLRQDIIWSKPNPMPESVTDRCTKAHEYIFLMSKSARYYYDEEAIAETVEASTIVRNKTPRNFQYEPANSNPSGGGFRGDGGINNWKGETTRNKRSVWEVATAPFSEAHFATFPPALIEPCIKAGTSEKGCCAKCGAPRVRQLSERVLYSEDSELDRYGNGKAGVHRKLGSIYQKQMDATPLKTIAWSPSCSCNAEVVPCTVLDPFGGAGTTGLVADRLQRNAILIELNPEYATMAERRIFNDAPLFAEAAE